MKCGVPLAAVMSFLLFATCSADSHDGLECPEGWILGWSKCYRVFHGDNRRAFARAKEVCQSYGSRLVTIKDQHENDLIGDKVEEVAGVGESYYIGLSKEVTDGCTNCPDLKWSNGEYASEYAAFWSDDHPDDFDGGCVFSQKNSEDYIYDRPFTWAYSSCLIKRSFVCERMAAPEGSFHCATGGYINRNYMCNGKSECEDGSDELNCPSNCRYYHTLPSGESANLGVLQYRDAWTCTWAIETPPGTNAYVQLNNFNTEYQADYVTVYIGSTSETRALRVDRISGNIGTRTYRSYNNMMFIKFTSDSSVSSTGTLTGFSGIYGALRDDTGRQVSLVADSIQRTYTLPTFDVANTATFLGQRDYIIVIQTQDQYQFGPMITLEIEDLQINDGDSVMFFDGDSPRDSLLATSCNDEDECNNYRVVYSTGKKLSILLRTEKAVSNNVAFRFKYTAGCFYETTDKWGTIYSPGFPAKINYPNFVKCTWKINVNEPIAIYFDSTSRLQDANYNRVVNGDYLKMYDDGTMVTGSSSEGFLTTSDIAGIVFTPTSGRITLELETSATRSAKGFLATWSTACPNPNYDDGFTIVSTPQSLWHYKSTMTVSCESGYAFQQEQLQETDIPTFMTSVTVECGFKGIWKNYLQIPKCTARYCGAVPSIPNAIIESATSVLYGGKAMYKCDAGSVSSSGSLEITCQADGSWSPRPTCIAATCQSGLISTSIANGNGALKTGDGTSIGTVYEFSCDPGYEFDGEPYVFCKDDGTWTQNRVPSCIRLKCLLPMIENGIYSGVNTVGQFINFEASATVSCNNGYELASDGPTRVTCSADRTLTELPRCVDRNECDTPGICQGQCHNTVGSFYCTCESGYTLGPDQSSCLDVNECTLNIHNCDQTCDNILGSYRCSCARPYVLYTADMISGFAIPTSAGETGNLPTDTYYIDHTCVLIRCDAPTATIQNGQLLTNRQNHYYGDFVEYQCDLGYTPRRTVLSCDKNGNWIGTVPTCTAATCSDIVGSVQTRPIFTPGPYAYRNKLTLECEVANRQFNRFRFCTYNKDTDVYEMQGSSYECGVVDCGQPKQEPGSTYGTQTDTLYGASFEFTCANNDREGLTSEGSSSTVKCLAEGYWDFGNLQCTGQSCVDPGYPAGGSIIATSFADKSTVTYVCDRNGYTLSRDVTLTCQGTNFFTGGVTVPTCIDTEEPVIIGCPTSPVIVDKYDWLQPRLPRLTVTDNTGVRTFTINPRNANSTLYVTSNTVVTYTATDYAGNTVSCAVQIQLTDETPPEINCPDVIYVELETETSSVQYDKLEVGDVTQATVNSIKTFRVDGDPNTLTVLDLYKTYTYTVSITDQADNPASCRGQIFVRPKPCSDLDFPTPLNADKVCTPLTFPANGRECVLTCQNSYTFEDSKSKTVRCSNGNWDTERITACVRDVTPPEVRCPSSVSIGNELLKRGDTYTVDFTALSSSVSRTDLNTMGAPVFSPQTYTFTTADLYRPKVIQVAVTDAAGNTGTCNFQYTAIPPTCSELSLPVPQFGNVECTPRTVVNGWDCVITCDTGKILRNHGYTKTVSCNNNDAWSDADIYPACIDDTKVPVITCPVSRTEKLYTGNEVRTVTFATDGSYSHSETDYSGIQSVAFSPQSLVLSTNLLNQAYTVSMTVTDNANNQATCTFQVLVEADDCSPLAFPAPVNGQKNCRTITNGYSCTVTCNAGHSFYGTTNTEIVTSCTNGQKFTQYIPDCASDADTANKQYIATLRYEYVPENDATATVEASCIDYYKNKVSERSATNNADSILDNMANRLRLSCDITYGPFSPGALAVSFFTSSTAGSIIDNLRRVQMTYQYTVLFNSDPDMDTTCTNVYRSQIMEAGNTFPLNQNIPGNGNCPTLKWNNFANVEDENEYCVAPFFESLTDSNICVRCPAGTQSDGTRCSVCPEGYYRTYAGTMCEQCPAGYTTRYQGAVDSNACVPLCSGGQVSNTGFSPCYSCPVGTYRISSTQCQSCGFGRTTSSTGSQSVDACVDSTSINDEPCTIGTQDVGNRVCELCSVGTYRSATTQTCVECQNTNAATYIRGAISSSQCYGKCNLGFISTTGRAPCSPCPKGQYAVNETSCETCPSDYTTVTEGSTNCVSVADLRCKCSTRKVKCPRGTYRDVNTAACVKCSEGTYNPIEEGTCLSCDSNEFTYFRGATQENMCQTKCPPGFYSSTGLSPCIKCGIGSYSAIYGASSCTPCSVNNDMRTATTTSTSSGQCIAKCPRGSFSYNGYDLNGACRQCPRNHYQDQEGATSCIQCASNSRFSSAGGLTSASLCSLLTNECDNKCQNNGNCGFQDNEPVCQCTQGQYYGPNCALTVNHCLSQPCYNGGACTSSPGGFTCNCVGTGATGNRCETVTKLCDTSQTSPTCKNGGHCINRPGRTECLCTEGFSGSLCEKKTENICLTAPCESPGTRQCRDVSRDSDLRWFCECNSGYTGETCAEDIDECASTPCINGGTCVNQQNRFQCNCPPGYSGTYCENREDRCQFYNCRQFDSSASCVDMHYKDLPTCICNPGYAYDGDGYTQFQVKLSMAPDNLANFSPQTQTTVVDCRNRCTAQRTNCNRFAFDTVNNRCYIFSSASQLNLISNSNVNMYTKDVRFPEDDFYTLRYSVNTPTALNPTDSELLSTLRSVYGLNICDGTEPLSARCCPVGTYCLDNDGLPFGTQCTTAGLSSLSTNTDYTVQFKCSVNRVFQNNDCRLKTNYCGLDTCKNGGNCQSIFGGYVCTCANGYTGRNCQTDIDDCAGNPCNNGGTCEDRVGGYTCKCTAEYEGPNCNSPKNLCLNQLCSQHGNCVNNVGVGYECNCLLGYEGTDCEVEIDFCKSDPCQHDGTCIKRVGGYTCSCVDGWQGVNCDSPVEHCSLQRTGRQCQAVCYNIFNDYYCQCEENSFGTNCENKPNPCRDYNKCQNSAQCSYDGSMSCSCPNKYTGDGCQILQDYCGKVNPCQNEGMCSVTANGYECTCKPGFNGFNCENEINECASVSCPGNGQCYDAINKYYCRCPIKYTGTNCEKVFDRNYDMYFNHPQGYGFALIPYFIEVNNANFVSISLWVRYSKNDGTGIYLTQFIGAKLEEASRFMEMDEQGVWLYFENDPSIQLMYDRRAKVNDGNWHLVTVLCDMVNGEAKLYLDSIWHDTETSAGLIMPAASYRMWVVLGCEFDNVDHRCSEGGRGFQGYLSQVNWYKRELIFEGDINSPTAEGREGEIPRNFRIPKHIFDANVADLILVWNEYEFESGVSRMTPSEAQGLLCDDVTRNPPCSSYRSTTTLSVTDCPEDKVVYSQDRIVTVTWVEPTFHNLGAQGRVVKPSQLPGSSFSHGVYRNTYIGIDSNNNKAYCHFTVYVTAGQCDSPPDPYGGSQTCDNVSDRKGCTISCNALNQNTYMIDRKHPDLFTCGLSGWWNADKPFRRFRYPSCGLIKEVPKQKIYIRVSYRIGTSSCIASAAKRNVEVRTYEEFRTLNELFKGDFCQNLDCTDLIVEVTCGSINKRRRRRQTASDNIMLLEITLNSVSGRTTLDGENISAEDFLTYFILGQQILDFDTVPDLYFQKENFQIQVTETCPVGQVLRNGQCIECGPGNYFRYTDNTNTIAICDDCPLGSYQDEYAASACKQCGNGLTTELSGEYLQTSCKKSCPVGEYFKTVDCVKCEIGYYQDEVGQFRCKGCLAGYTTKEEGSNSSSLCSVSCSSGYELNDRGQCVPCSIGQYRDATLTRTCVSCPSGFITETIASRSRAACSIVACSAGTYRDVNTCKPCPVNTYQPDEWKTSCISCGDPLRWRTVAEGSDSVSKCLYYCESGYEVKENPNRCEICPIGTYKDNTLDIQGFCVPCPNNRRTVSAGSTSSSDCTIYKCPVGYKPNDLNTDCVECPLGYYQDEEYSTDCKKCADDYSTRQTASTSSGSCERYCPAGQERVGEICVPCRTGFYKDNNNGLFEQCAPCNVDYTTAGTGSDQASDCNVRTCTPGKKRNADDTGCEDCPIGTYQPQAYQKDCIACNPGTSTRSTASTLQTDCESYCDPGYEKTSTGCVGCEIGYYKENANNDYFSPCTLCPIDYITEGKNSQSASLCNVGNCSAGQYLKPDKMCGLCEKGFYQPDKWQTECIQCGKDKTTENVGSDELSDCILECSPGYEDIGGSCQECKRGFYKIVSAAASCKPCPVGLTTETTGADNSDLCILPACTAGQYLDRVTNPANPQCRLCGYDSYQDEIWQEQCKPCLNNRVTLGTGADEVSDCVLDCASGTEYDSASQRCEFCAIGYYRNRNDRQQTQCQLCPTDKLTSGEGGTDVSECVIANCTVDGYYRDTATNTCMKCPIGSYNDLKWQTSCTVCPLGNSTKFTGSTSIDDCRSICPLGQYVGSNNNCELCARGTYRSDMAADTCTQCPNRLLTPGPGADSESDCSISPCVAGERYVLNDRQCYKCAVGSYQPNPGSFQCIDCPFAVKYTPREGAVSDEECRSPCSAGEQFDAGSASCVACPSGMYQPVPFQYSCLQCPDGRKYTERTGSLRIEDCLSYCSAAGANVCSVNATCSVTNANSQGYACECFTNYESVGARTGEECVHKCDRGYCKNDATCSREATLSCTCSQWYSGDRCQTRIDAEELSDNTLDIVIPVSIAAGGLILFLIILAVCCLCWRRAHPMKTTEHQYSEFNGDRIDKGSLHSHNYGVPYASRPPSRLMMLAPAQEMYYDNQIYASKDHSVIDGSVLDTAVYEA